MTDYEKKVWILLSETFGYEKPIYKALNSLYNDISLFYDGGEAEWRLSGLFSNQLIEKLHKAKINSADKIISDCKLLGYSIICIGDEQYPKRLYDIDCPPGVLYVEGLLPKENIFSLSVVGTRRASQYGIQSSYTISHDVAKAGGVIVSGGAVGIDGAAHRGALDANGITVCVLGCGLDINYPKDNYMMRKAIVKSGGALISEYPPHTEPRGYLFPMRNRIISSLGNAILVVEAGMKSGSMITAGYALEQGKDVFAVMGNIDLEGFRGSNQLIKDGAVPVTSYKDIIERYDVEIDVDVDDFNIDYDTIPVKGKQNNKRNDKVIVPVHKDNIKLSDNFEKIYYAISNDPVHIDEIIEITKLPIREVISGTSQLEIMSLIECVKGRFYKLI